MASRILCWGSHDARGVRDLCAPDVPKTIVETGSPRVDLWRREFTDYYRRSSPPLSREVGEYVLVASNLAFVLNLRPFWEEVSLLRDKYPKEGPRLFDEEHEYALYREAGWLTCLLAEFVRMIRALAAASPKLRIVVRPHPAEIEEGWRVLIGDCPNVIVTREGAVSGWIRGARALIHNGCTTGFEAAVSGIPRIAYAPIRSEFEKTVPNSVSHRAETLEALLEAVHAVLRGGTLDGASERQAAETALLKDRFANLDGPLAADRIVDEWDQLADPSLERANDWAALRRVMTGRRLRSAVGRAFPALGRRPARRASITKHKYPGLDDAEMQSLVGSLASSLGRFDRVVCERLGERSFTFRRR
jgi:surface carbohydrate biosynthesis protein